MWVRGGAVDIYDVWSSDTHSSEGLLVTDSGRGSVTQLSSEHHAQNELVFRNSSNWHVVTLQTEDFPDKACALGSTPVSCTGGCVSVDVSQAQFYRSSLASGGWPQAVLFERGALNTTLRNAHFFSGSKLPGANYNALCVLDSGEVLAQQASMTRVEAAASRDAGASTFG